MGKLEFGVASRTVWLIKKSKDVYWEIAEKYNIEKVLKKAFSDGKVKNSIIIQGEIIGAKIQRNKYNLPHRELRVYNLEIDGEIISLEDSIEFIENELDLTYVPVINENVHLKDTVSEMVDSVKGKSTLDNKILREGSVFKSYDNPYIAFKVINPDYLIKHQE